jgi:ribosomal protein L14
VGSLLKVTVGRYKKQKRKPHISVRDYKKSLFSLKSKYTAVVLFVRVNLRRNGSFFLKFDKNVGVLVSASGVLLAKRLKTFAPAELLKLEYFNRYSKILLASKFVL